MKKNKSGNCNKVTEIELNGRKIFVSETETGHKGSFSYTDQNGKVLMVIDKAFGKIGAQRKTPLPSYPPSYYDKILKSKSDLLGKKILSQKGDPSYEQVVDLLPPLRFPYTFLGDKGCHLRPLPRIDWDGSIRGCLGFGLNGKPPGWGEQYNVKHSLLDGYLPAIQFEYVNEKEKIAVARAYPLYEKFMFVFIRLKVRNLGHCPRKENITIFFSHFSQPFTDDYTYVYTPDFYPTCGGSSAEDKPEWLWVSEENDYKKGKVYPFGFNRPCHLKAGEEKSFYLILAYPRYLKQGTFKRLVPGFNFYRALFEVKKDWDHFLDKGMQVETPEPRVNNACKATLIQSFMTVAGSDVKYAAAGNYEPSRDTHLNGLPISIINAAECFSEWGYLTEVKKYLTYFLKHYIKTDGIATYKGGTGGYDYGLLLYAICRFYHLNNKDAAWVRQNISPIKNICNYIIRERNEGLRSNPAGSPLHGLIGMISCDDLRGLGDKFYNYATDACCWLGLREAGKMMVETGGKTAAKTMLADGTKMINFAEAYKKDILTSIKKSIDHASKPVFVPIYPDNNKPFSTLTSRMPPPGLTSYANFGFYLFMLYSNLLDSDISSAVVEFREKRGGEVLGTSRIFKRLDDWPIAIMGWTLINLDMIKKFLLTYYGDLAHHRMRDIFTAYEQVDFKVRENEGNGRKICGGHNICSTLAVPRMTKYMLVFEERDKDLIWLNRAVPGKWLEDGKRIIVKNAPTRWGKIGYWIESHISKNYISAQIDFAGPSCGSLLLNLRLRHPDHKKIRGVKINGREWQGIDTNKEIINIPCPHKVKISIEACY